MRCYGSTIATSSCISDACHVTTAGLADIASKGAQPADPRGNCAVASTKVKQVYYKPAYSDYIGGHCMELNLSVHLQTPS